MPTKIPWADESWPVVTGCTHTGGPGCDHCYAARMAATRLRDHPRYEGLATIKDGKARWTGRVNLNHDVLEQPLHWQKPRMVFVASMGDLFHEDVPPSYVGTAVNIMKHASQHTFQILTKRPRRMLKLTNWLTDREGWPDNVWLGTSIENQAAADERIPWLLQTPAAVRFVSVEPILGPVDLTNMQLGIAEWGNALRRIRGVSPARIDWVICGGESGPGARPMHPDWARSLRDQCQAAGTPFFLKQWGEYLGIDYTGEKVAGVPMWTRADGLSGQIDRRPEIDFGDGHGAVRVGRKRAGRLLDGQVWDQFPVGVTG